MSESPTVFQLATRPAVVKSAIAVAIVVGMILNLINQGDAIFGDKPVVVWKLLLTFCVPYCVSTYGSVMALRSQS